MALVVPNVGAVLALKNFLNHTAPQNQTLKLFKSNTTPGETDTAVTYTVADFTGYSDASLTGTSWTVTEADPASAAYAQQTFTSSAGSQNQNVYGYYAVQASSGILMFAERFTDGPYNIANNGDAIKVTPTITAD